MRLKIARNKLIIKLINAMKRKMIAWNAEMIAKTIVEMTVKIVAKKDVKKDVMIAWIAEMIDAKALQVQEDHKDNNS
jgi:hypothetical protein